MKKSLMLGLIVLVAALSAYGQTPTVKAKIAFPFTVEGKALPAGTYEFILQESGDAFRVQGEGKDVMANVITRLGGEMRSAPKGTHLVFDKVGELCLLSEIWIPEQDGFLLLATKGLHAHKTVNVM
jgi:hypothetical protein